MNDQLFLNYEWCIECYSAATDVFQGVKSVGVGGNMVYKYGKYLWKKASTTLKYN